VWTCLFRAEVVRASRVETLGRCWTTVRKELFMEGACQG
jgi:hypothetical protein